MDTHLSKHGEDQLKALANTIGASHELAAEVQEELYGHLEDQALAYLSGEEAVTEEDAILLTREHFGDARALKEWLSSVHAEVDHSRFYARLAPIAVVTMLIHAMLLPGQLLRHVVLIRDFLPLSVLLCTLFGLWILVRWRRQELRGQSMWWEHRRTRRTALGVASALALVSAYGWQGLTAPPAPAFFLPEWFLLLSMLISEFLLPFAWLWWADLPPRRWRTSIEAVGAFFLLNLTLQFLRLGMGVLRDPSMQVLDVNYVAQQAGTLLVLVIVLLVWRGFSYGARLRQPRLG